jgi:thiol:disulfide interchange protein
MRVTASSTRRALLLLGAALVLPLRASLAADLPQRFDPRRDPAADIASAVSLAAAQGKHVMVDVGGEWCSWCHLLDQFIASNEDVRQLVAANYVWVKVNYSPENKNQQLLSRWPKVKGYPHLFVLDAEGALVHSQDTGVLEARHGHGHGYDKAKVLAFLRRYR